MRVRGENDSKQSDEFQAISVFDRCPRPENKREKGSLLKRRVDSMAYPHCEPLQFNAKYRNDLFQNN